ncbi:MAG: hypothetical protein K2X87_01275 [Gemmataceae bacterium]|nr:hypothetical protein [Gemmataceae bacterium]
MSKIVIDGPTLEKFLAAGGTVEVIEPSGKPVGKFTVYPRFGNYVADDWPSDEELDRRSREGKGVPAAEVEERLRKLEEGLRNG